MQLKDIISKLNQVNASYSIIENRYNKSLKTVVINLKGNKDIELSFLFGKLRTIN